MHAATDLQALVAAPGCAPTRISEAIRLRLAAALLDLGNHLMLSADERKAFRLRGWLSSARALAYNHSEWEMGKSLGYSYFSQGLLTEYQEEGLIAGLWRDSRGNLHEPHTRNSVALGTPEIANYEFPEYTFDKILYVEKEGELPKLRAAKLGERYDMAICSGKGQPTARVMAEETRRMPDYFVDVVDIGLTVEDAVEMGLASEPFRRKKDITWELRMRLSGVAKEYLYQRNGYGGGISGYRFELNAILPDIRRVEYIERKLEENGVRGKVIPPDEALAERREAMYRAKVDGWVDEVIAEMLDADELKNKMAEQFQERFGLDEAREWIEKGFEDDRAQSWRGVLKAKLEKLYEDEHKGDLRDSVREYVQESVDEGEEDDE